MDEWEEFLKAKHQVFLFCSCGSFGWNKLIFFRQRPFVVNLLKIMMRL
jgi:hypothetical protein